MIKPAKIVRLRHILPLTGALFGFFVVQSAPVAADDNLKVKLLSTDEADACIKDQPCLQELFLQAALGPEDDQEAAVFKWTVPARIGHFIGDETPTEQREAIDNTLPIMGLVAKSAGASFGLATGLKEDVINILLLASDDFERDRDGAFSQLLADAFQGQLGIYDSLLEQEGPICNQQLFADDGAIIAGGLVMAETDIAPEALQSCLYRSMIQILGLRHELPTGADSLLDPSSDREAWTSIDYVLLKLLYHPMIEPGMTRTEVIEVFPKLFDSALKASS